MCLRPGTNKQEIEHKKIKFRVGVMKFGNIFYKQNTNSIKTGAAEWNGEENACSYAQCSLQRTYYLKISGRNIAETEATKNESKQN